MSVLVPLDRVPNQTMTVALDGRRYTLTVKDVGDVMAMDVLRDDEVVTLGMRVVADTPVLPYRYLEAGAGNFIFVSTVDGLIPRWEDFGVTTQLLYTSAAELGAIRNGLT